MNDATPQDTGPLLLVDGSSYLYRAYHALPDLRGPEGVPTGAIHGMVAMMKKAIQDVKPSHAVCVFDAKGKTFRDDWYPEYKAQRSAMPEPLVQQIEPIHEVVKLLGWPVLTVPGVEADDVIGTLSSLAPRAGQRVVLSPGDHDLAQLQRCHRAQHFAPESILEDQRFGEFQPQLGRGTSRGGEPVHRSRGLGQFFDAQSQGLERVDRYFPGPGEVE